MLVGLVGFLLLIGAGCTPESKAPVAIPADSGNGLNFEYNQNGAGAQAASKANTTGATTSDPLVDAYAESGVAGPITNLTVQEKLSLKQPTMEIDQTKQYSAVLHTSAGDITIEFNKGSTPVTVNNFVTLARQGFYNGTIFHRVINGFMIQGGDPIGDGTGGPGYRFADEPFQGDYTRGTVAMANAGPNTNGSQFFIMHQTNPLPKNYTIFGHVTAGMNVVDDIAEAAVTASAMGEPSKPVKPVTVTGVDVIEK